MSNKHRRVQGSRLWVSALLVGLLGSTAPSRAQETKSSPSRPRGIVKADAERPRSFPHRIWAACDFEGATPDYGWFGTVERAAILSYPGNKTALRGQPAKDQFAYFAGINPVPGPRMGKSNGVYFRYHLRGTDTAQVQHFNLSKEDNHHVVVTGMKLDQWSELALDFTASSRRNDGSPGAMEEGDRMDDLKVLLGKTGDGKAHELLLDDVILFANDPALPPEPEPFPRRVIFLAAFDTGEKEKYWPGEFEIVEKDAPPGACWRVARSVARKDGQGSWIRVGISPPRPVGAHTKLRFRYFLSGARSLTAQIFDVTAGDNRHVRLADLKEGSWETKYVDFTRDSRRNDGSTGAFAAGNEVDDLFFFVEPTKGQEARLCVDEVVLYDAGA